MLFEDFQLDLGIGASDLLRLIRTAPKRYKVYEIDKRSGGKRVIAQPAREIKQLQYYIIDHYLAKAKVHDIAAAYVRGKSIRDNALVHVNSSYIMKLDFTNFFNSIVPYDLEKAFRLQGINMASEDKPVLASLLFWGQGSVSPRCLSVGAPSSPLVSNIVMYDLDHKIMEVAQLLGLRISRYADDITVSGSELGALSRFERKLTSLLGSSKSPRLTLNDKKRGVYSRGERRMVTGLIITPEKRISIGRDRKRLISSMVHKATLNQLSIEEMIALRGYLSFVISAEPKFLETIIQKYGSDVVHKLNSIA